MGSWEPENSGIVVNSFFFKSFYLQIAAVATDKVLRDISQTIERKKQHLSHNFLVLTVSEKNVILSSILIFKRSFEWTYTVNFSIG